MKIKVKSILIISFLLLLGSYGFGQKTIKQNFDSTGVLTNEYIDLENDTILERIYYDGKQLMSTFKNWNGMRNGISHHYKPNGDLVIEQFFINNKVHGWHKTYYANGNYVRYEKVDHGFYVDTSYFFNEDSTLYSKAIYTKPCELGNNECDKTILMFKDNTLVYTYEINKGWKSKEHKIYDKERYSTMMKEMDDVPEKEKGESIFKIKCAMCHNFNVKLVGPQLDCQLLKKGELNELVNGANGHHNSKLTKEEVKQLELYLRKNCK